MLVRFIESNYRRAQETVAAEYQDTLSIGDYLEDGQLYVVFAVYPRLWGVKDRPGFVLRHTLQDMPLQYDSQLFDVVDRRLSKWWVFHSEIISEPNEPTRRARSWLAFSEWTRSFHYSLVDFVPAAVRTFKKYEKLIEWEWPRPDISQEAQVLDDDWVMCPNCTESWEVDPRLALCQCPSCKRMLSNPYWHDPMQLEDLSD